MRKGLLIVGIILLVVGGIVFFDAYSRFQIMGHWMPIMLLGEELDEELLGDEYESETSEYVEKYAELEVVCLVSGIVAIAGAIFTGLGTVLEPSPKRERKLINKKWAGITIGIIAIAVISLVAFVYFKPGPKDLIIGRWRGESGNYIFDTGGRATFIGKAGKHIKIEYKWLDKDTIKYTYPTLGISETFNVWISKNTLTLASLDGKGSNEFQRVAYSSAKEEKGPLKEIFTLKSLIITTDKTYPTVEESSEEEPWWPEIEEEDRWPEIIKIITKADKTYPTVLLSFKILDDVTLSLIDPTGVETDKEYVKLGGTGTKLHLTAKLGEVSKKGNYKLVVKDIRDRVIFTKNFSLTKPVKVMEKELKFYTDKEKYDYKKDNKIVINIKNVGEECLLIPNAEMVLFNENTSIRAGRGEIKREDVGTIWVPSKETISLIYSFVPRQGIIISPKYSFKFYSEEEFIGGSNIFNCGIIQPE